MSFLSVLENGLKCPRAVANPVFLLTGPAASTIEFEVRIADAALLPDLVGVFETFVLDNEVFSGRLIDLTRRSARAAGLRLIGYEVLFGRIERINEPGGRQ